MNKRNKRGGRAALQAITSNEGNKTNRKRRTTRNSNKTEPIELEVLDGNNKNKNRKLPNPADTQPTETDADSDAETEQTQDVITEPPKKKRKMNHASDATTKALHDLPENEVDDSSEFDLEHECKTEHHNVPMLPQQQQQQQPQSLYSGGNLNAIRNQRRSNKDLHARNKHNNDEHQKLHSNNQQLIKNVVKYKKGYKALERKCKAFRHEYKTLKQMMSVLTSREKRSKTQRQSDMDNISRLQQENERVSKELDRHMHLNIAASAGANTSSEEQLARVQHDMQQVQEECSRWRSKYNQLLSVTNKCQETDVRVEQLKKELARSKSLHDMERTALESDRKHLREEHRNLIETAKLDHVKLNRIMSDKKTTSLQLKTMENEKEVFRQKLEAMEQKYQSLSQATDERATKLRQEHKRLESESRLMEAQSEKYVAKIEQLSREILGLQEERKSCIELHVNRRDVEMLQNELNSLSRKYDESCSGLKEMQRKHNKNKKESAVLRTQNDELANQCVAFKQDISSLQQKLKQWSDTCALKEKQCADIRNEMKELSSKMSELQCKYREAKQSVTDSETLRLSFETEKTTLLREIKRYSAEMEGLQMRMQSLWKRYEAEKTKAKMWKTKLKVLAEQNNHRISNINQWVLECRESEFELDDFDGQDDGDDKPQVLLNADASEANNHEQNHDESEEQKQEEDTLTAAGDGDDDDDDVLKSPMHRLERHAQTECRFLDSITERSGRSDKEHMHHNRLHTHVYNDADVEAFDSDDDIDVHIDTLLLSPIPSDASTVSNIDYSVSSPSPSISICASA